MCKRIRQDNLPLIVEAATNELGSVKDLDLTIVTVSQREQRRVVLLSFGDFLEQKRAFVDVIGI